MDYLDNLADFRRWFTSRVFLIFYIFQPHFQQHSYHHKQFFLISFFNQLDPKNIWIVLWKYAQLKHHHPAYIPLKHTMWRKINFSRPLHRTLVGKNMTQFSSFSRLNVSIWTYVVKPSPSGQTKAGRYHPKVQILIPSKELLTQ